MFMIILQCHTRAIYERVEKFNIRKLTFIYFLTPTADVQLKATVVVP